MSDAGEVNVKLDIDGELGELWAAGVLKVYKRSFGVGPSYAQWEELRPNPSFRHFFLGDRPQGWNPVNIAFRFDFRGFEDFEDLGDTFTGKVIVNAVKNNPAA